MNSTVHIISGAVIVIATVLAYIDSITIGEQLTISVLALIYARIKV